MVKSFIKGDQTGWDLNIPFLTAAYRASVHERTGMTPNLVMLGREVRLPVYLVYKEVCDLFGTQNVAEYPEALRSKLVGAQGIARKHLNKAYVRQKDYYNQLNREQFDAGDLVLILNETRRVGETKILQPSYEGPVLIVEKLSDLNYK